MTGAPPTHPSPTSSTGFWSDALEWRASVTRAVLPGVALFGLIGLLARIAHELWPWDRVALVHIEYTGGDRAPRRDAPGERRPRPVG